MVATPARGLPCDDNGTPTPDGPSWLNQVNAEVGGLWDAATLGYSSLTGTNTLVATTTPVPIPAYKQNMSFWLQPPNDTTGAVTINIDGKGAKQLRDRNGVALSSGALRASGFYLIVYDGTRFRVLIEETSLAQVSSPLARGYLSPGGFKLSNVASPGDTINDILMGAGAARDALDAVNLFASGSIIKQLDTIWAAGTNAGGMLQTTNPLNGSVSCTAAGTSLTGVGTNFLTDFHAGDVVAVSGGNTRRVAATPASNTSLQVTPAWTTTRSGVTHKRGGKAPNTCYRFFALRRDSNGDIDACASPRDTPVDLPAGYSAYRRVGFILTDLSAAPVNLPFAQYGDLFVLNAKYLTQTNTVSGTLGTATIQGNQPPNCLIFVTSAAIANISTILMRPVNVVAADGYNGTPALTEIPTNDTGQYYADWTGGPGTPSFASYLHRWRDFREVA